MSSLKRPRYPSAEAAALADVPSRFGRVLLRYQQDDYAIVLLEENEAPVLHYYFGIMERDAEGWREVAYSGDLAFQLEEDSETRQYRGQADLTGSEWELWVAHAESQHQIDNGEDVAPEGIGVFVKEAPKGAKFAVLETGNEQLVIPLIEGYVLVVDWHVRDDDWRTPRVLSFHAKDPRISEG